MTSIPLPVLQLLEKYEFIFNAVNSATQPIRVYPGNSQLVSDYGKISNPTEADTFFAIYGVGNATFGVHIPFERQIAYELLLEILKSLDPVQYHKIHKGTL